MLRTAFLAILFVLTLTPAFAAPPSLVGVDASAIDTSGAAVPRAGVTVFATGSNGAPVATTKADAYGRFHLELEPGAYVVQINATGLEAVETLDVSADRRTMRQEFMLQPSVHESITVQAPSGYSTRVVTTATKTPTLLRDVPQSVTVVTRELMQDQLMSSIGDVVRYVPGVSLHQGENNRDQIIMRGNSSSADFFVDGVRDDVQYYRDLYNLERVEALKGPNAMIFGRGGAGGVINRVTKEAGFTPIRELSMQGGAYGNKRVNGDFGAPISDRVAVRFNGVYEDSDSFRSHVGLARYGLAPSISVLASDNTKISFGYERFRDHRTADRGMTSFEGRPADVAVDTFYGNPSDSRVNALVNLASASIEHMHGAWTLTNRTLFGDYDRGYQNYVPGAVSANKSTVTMTAYNNATQRRNVFNQTNATLTTHTGRLRHTLLGGLEGGVQGTDNFRNTGYFNNTSTSTTVPYLNPIVTVPVTFRQSATDADNHVIARIASAYVQDQLEVSSHLQFVTGLRYDRFALDFRNRRNGDHLTRADSLVSPRAGIVVKPVTPLSLYATWSVSYLPGSGDQFSSLTSVTEQLQPEKFDNYEIGAKWDVSDDLSFTTAAYRLDRTNTRSTDPNDPTRIVQTGSQRTNGFELGVSGRVNPAWSIAGGYAYQDATVISATATAKAGARVAQVPQHTFSLWNNVDFHPRAGAALGLIARSAMFATIDDTVTLPGYLRVDVAAYYRIANGTRVQLNIENLTNRRYYANADSNTNISPGSPRAARIALVTRF